VFIGSPQIELMRGMVEQPTEPPRSGSLVAFRIVGNSGGLARVNWSMLAYARNMCVLEKSVFPATVALVQPVGPATQIALAWETGHYSNRSRLFSSHSRRFRQSRIQPDHVLSSIMKRDAAVNKTCASPPWQNKLKEVISWQIPSGPIR